MADQVEKYNVNNILFLNKSSIKEEKCEGIDELENHDKMKQYEISNDIKTDFLSCKAEDNNITNYTVKTEEEVIVDNIKMEFENGLYCEYCLVYYEDYCTKCGMLVHILNKNAPNDTIKVERVELPDHILEIQNNFGRLGIFALKVIPEGVKFGPFVGFSNTEYLRKNKEQKFVAGKEKTKYLNWMKYINFARSPFERNLLAFQCNNNLYYRSICEIQKSDELLVHFGEEYENSITIDLEVNFIPRAEYIIQDIYACTFCCLGFNSSSNLVKHKTVCSNNVDGQFPNEELTQCSFCKIYLYQEEYCKHHMIYCSANNDRKRVQLPMGNQRTVATGRKTQRRRIYKCAQCKYRTKYKGDLENHTNKHYQVKIYKCGICNRRFMRRDFLAQHTEISHVYADKENLERSRNAHVNEEHALAKRKMKRFKCCVCEFRTKYKIVIKGHIKSKHLLKFDYKCESRGCKTNNKPQLDLHARSKHLKEFDYKCEFCRYKTNRKAHFEVHMKTKHLKEFDYKCASCNYKTNYKSNFEKHVKVLHLKEVHYKCDLCQYKTNRKSNLEVHIKSNHLKEFDYKCDSCQYGTNIRLHLDMHVKTKHLEVFDYKCELCDYKTNQKSNFEKHIKSKHLQEFDYKCQSCDYKTNRKSDFEKHVKASHLKEEADYKCESCDYKTNYMSNLYVHVKTKHPVDYDYKCELCDYKTNRKTIFEKHTKSKHLQEFDYKCESCDYKTNTKSAFNRHVKASHLKEVDYKCQSCDYKTNYKSNLDIHMKRKHLKELN